MLYTSVNLVSVTKHKVHEEVHKQISGRSHYIKEIAMPTVTTVVIVQ